ncbi:MAG: hypothetical protein ACXWWW_07115 [Candidatus Deferrimicrobiaceae bacterium]
MRKMEGIVLEEITVGFGGAIAGFLILAAAYTVAILASIAEEEEAGAHSTWAEWPLPEAEKAAPPVVVEKVRLAA